MSVGASIALLQRPELAAALADAPVGFRLPAFTLGGLDWSHVAIATIVLVIPQLPLTFGNALIAIVEEKDATPQQRVALTAIVANIQTGRHRHVVLACLVQLHQFGDHLAQRLAAFVTVLERSERHGVAQHARTHWVAFRVIGVQQAVRCCALRRLRELAAQIDRVLDPEVEALPAHG